jgi:large subunit ribosomal protein L35
MERPIYRHLADKKWREQKRLILDQRLTQMYVVPDVLPLLDLTADISISFGRKTVHPGEFVDSQISETAPTLDVQVFDRGPRLVTIVAMDADVPNPEKDNFDFRCHFIGTNIELSPSKPTISLKDLPSENVALPWMPPHAQKGSPYHRLTFFVLQQPEGKVMDVASIREKEPRLGFNLRGFNQKHKVKPVSATLFRTVWDDNTAQVMKRAGIEGSDVMFKRKKPEALPWQYKVKDGARYR